MPVQRFPIGAKQQVFYGATSAIFTLLRTYTPEFKTYKAFYTPNYVDDLFTKLQAAEALPTAKEATKLRKQLRRTVVTTAKDVHESWGDMKGYVKTAYPVKADFEVQIGRAGWESFDKGATDWSAVKDMIGMTNRYLVTAATKLKENDNMPDDFPSDFQRLGKKFTDAFKAYQDAEQSKDTVAENKNNANEEVYQLMVSVVGDGQRVFKKDLAKKRLFSYAYQKALLSGGVATYKGDIRDEHGNPIPDVAINSTQEKYSTTTDKDGKFKLRMKAGDWVLVMSKPDYVTLQEAVTLEPATGHTVHLVMQSVDSGELRSENEQMKIA